jgi:TonB family protein
MFDYAIGHYQMHPPSRRLLASWFVSVVGHIAAVLILIRYPQLLYDGVHLWIRPSPASPEIVERKWRNLAVVSTKMQMPPIDEIRKNLYDWERARAMQENHQAIRINLPTGIIDNVPAPLPKSKPETPPVRTIPVPAAPGTTSTNMAPVPASAELARVETVETKKPAVGNTADIQPKQIPKGVPDAPPPGSNPTDPTGAGKATRPASTASGSKDAKDPGQQIRAQGPVFFDTQGFNLDEYANLVRERVKQNWFIPSNLRLYQGSATILFYIGKDGQVTGAKIELSSGNGSLDISALKAVMDSIPFPLLPKGFPAERVGARLIFAYNEK